MISVFTGQVELGEGVSADDVQDVEQGEVDGQQDDTQQGDRQHLEPTRYLTTHISISGEIQLQQKPCYTKPQKKI